MNNADSPKPPLAPKPKTAGHFTPVAISKFPPSPRSDVPHSPNSMSRGPKPPIAPKPKLTTTNRGKTRVYMNNTFNKCSNGKLICSDGELYEGNQSNPECSESEADDEYILVTETRLTKGNYKILEQEREPCCSENEKLASLPVTREEETEAEDPCSSNCSSSFEGKVEEPEEDSLSSTDRVDDSSELPLGGDCERTDQFLHESPGRTENQDSMYENTGEDTDCENDPGEKDKLFMNKEGDNLIENQNGYSLERKRICTSREDCKDIILTHIASDEPEASGEQPGDPEESLDVGDANSEECADTEPSLSDYNEASDMPPTEREAEGDGEEAENKFSERLEPCNELNETGLAVEDPDNSEITDWGKENTVGDDDQDTEVKDEQEEEEATIQGVEEDQDTEDMAKDEVADENCQIIPFESEGGDELLDSLPGNSFAFLPTESTSFCSDSYYPLPESVKESESGVKADSGLMPMEFLVTGNRIETTLKKNHEIREAEDVSGDGGTLSEQLENDEQAPVTELVNNQSGSPEDEAFEVPAVVIVPEENLDDETVDDSLIDPYVMGVSLIHRDENTFPGGRGYSETKDDGTQSSCGIKEEMNTDADNGLITVDRKNIVTRARSHSGKVPGYVPETVPEETGPETDLLTMDSRRAGQEGNKLRLPMEGKPLEINRALPAKPRSFLLYPRSFSVEGRDLPISLFRELEESMLDDGRIKRKEDNLSLPCVIGSSGSFSQRSHLSSSGMSTPSSVVDIPPPFDLACITKKPITKSSPSLLIDNDSSDKYTKKKKSSFKRFLALTFKKRTENKVHVDVNVSSSRSSSESSYHGPSRVLEIDRRSLSNSPQLKSRSGKLRASDPPSSIIFYRDMKRKGAAFSRSVSRVESFEDRSRPPFLPLPLTKPRSISFPNADTSDYENIPAMNSDYENIQIPPRRPTRAGTFTKLFEDPSRALSTANENDGYVDMSSFNAFESKQQTTDQETESAYTEPHKVCMVSAVPTEDVTSDEEQKSSEEEEEGSQREPGLTHKKEGQSRAYVIAQELLSSEKVYGQVLQHLVMDFHEAVLKALSEETEDNEESLARGELRQGLSELPAIYELHQEILSELEERILNWEEQPKVADIFLTREPKFDHHVAYIMKFDKNLTLLNGNCIKSSQLATTIKEFESPQSGGQGVKHQLLKVVEHIFQYQVLLTDYLNNLCPDSAEYEHTQDALALISKVTDRANDSMEQGENLQKLVHIEHSVRGQNNLLQPGREFLKEGTLMKVTGKSRHPRHLFLMNDVLLYTFPQKDGKYRLKNTLAVSSMRVSRPVMEKVPYALKIESAESCLMLSASSCSERDEWYSCLSRALPEDYKLHSLAAFHNSVEIRERLGICLGERPPTLVPVSHVMMCMNCGCDFSLTLRRHHCHACGKIVCRNCSRNKYPLKYLKDRLAKVCDGCYAELKKRGGDIPMLLKERPVSMSFPMSSPRFSSGAFSSVFHSINPSAFKKQKKIPSALTEVAASGEGSAISGYLSRRKKGKRQWKTLWFVIKGKVLYTYMASEDKVATESIPLLGFTIAPEEGNRELGLIFHLYHKQTLFYSFKAEDINSAQRWVEAMKDATVL